MIRAGDLATETRIARSPVWIRLRDAFTGGTPRGRIEPTLERWDGSAWIPATERPSVNASGDLVYIGLGRAREPAAVGTLTYRLRVAADGYRPDYPPPGGAVELTVTAWRDDLLPAASTIPLILPLLPAPTYPFPAGTPLAGGRIEDASGAAVVDAEVSSTVVVAGTSLTERVLSDDHGTFRLPLRWAAGAVPIQAAKGAAAGSTTLIVPADLATSHTITIT